MRSRKQWWQAVLAVLLVLGGGLGVAHAADLHLVQQFEIRQGQVPLLQEHREIYLQGSGAILRNPTHFFLIRADMQRAWLLDADRQSLGEIPVDQVRGELAGTRFNPGPLPPIQPTNETRKLQGLTCHVYRAAAARLAVEACVTRQLAALEKFRDLLGATAEVPGVPLEFVIQIAAPDQSALYTIRQTLLKVETTRLDPSLFAPPMQSATPLRPVS
jgi:hypothetical protein